MLRWLPSHNHQDPIQIGADGARLAWSTGTTAAVGPRRESIQRVLASGASVTTAVVGNDTAVHWMQSAPPGVASLSELREVASARCASLFGGSADDWIVSGHWSWQRPFLCAALPKSLVQELISLGLSAAIDLQTACTATLRTNADQLPDEGWICIRGFATLTVLHASRGEVDHVSAQRIEPGCSHEAVRAEALCRIRVDSARTGRALGANFHWVDLAGNLAPTGRSTQGRRLLVESEAEASLAALHAAAVEIAA